MPADATTEALSGECASRDIFLGKVTQGFEWRMIEPLDCHINVKPIRFSRFWARIHLIFKICSSGASNRCLIHAIWLPFNQVWVHFRFRMSLLFPFYFFIFKGKSSLWCSRRCGLVCCSILVESTQGLQTRSRTNNYLGFVFFTLLFFLLFKSVEELLEFVGFFPRAGSGWGLYFPL